MLKKSVAEQLVWENIDWITVSQKVDQRNTKQCRDRWHNYLRPGIIKGHWTLQEEELIKDMHLTFGAKYVSPHKTHKRYTTAWHFYSHFFHVDLASFSSCFCRWCTMAKLMKNRAENDIKNKWYSMVRKEQRLQSKSITANGSPHSVPPIEPLPFDYQAFPPMPDISTSTTYSLEDDRKNTQDIPQHNGQYR